jgi:hypothetical protein
MMNAGNISEFCALGYNTVDSAYHQNISENYFAYILRVQEYAYKI